MNSSAIIPQQDNNLFERIAQTCMETPRVAILMSGTGSNARNILEQRHRYPNFQFVAIVTDRPSTHCYALAREFGLAHILVMQWGKIPFDRKAFFNEVAQHFRHMGVNLLIYAGFLKVAPKDFLTEFPGINIHPADLTIRDKTGMPKYRGIAALSYALNAGEQYVASSIHVVEEAVDGGLIIAISKHLPVPTHQTYDLHELHEDLKCTCEHPLYPQVLALLSRGHIAHNMLPLRAEYRNLDELI